MSHIANPTPHSMFDCTKLEHSLGGSDTTHPLSMVDDDVMALTNNVAAVSNSAGVSASMVAVPITAPQDLDMSSVQYFPSQGSEPSPLSVFLHGHQGDKMFQFPFTNYTVETREQRSLDGPVTLTTTTTIPASQDMSLNSSNSATPRIPGFSGISNITSSEISPIGQWTFPNNTPSLTGFSNLTSSPPGSSVMPPINMQTSNTGFPGSQMMTDQLPPSNPQLLRSTQIPVGLPGSNSTYPLPHKANLKINGNLDEMAINWTEDEWQTRRRLIQFWRRQEGNTIHCAFQPITLKDRAPNSIVISCIFWEERNECFVTSVDCIYLLEALVGARFTVEEKNRIRRNLEGFRPLTVSKSKTESESFFKLIMSFPNPKPRNIEKDVKVFPWKILSSALKKIISKYSASYSSTVGAPMDAYGGSVSLEPTFLHSRNSSSSSNFSTSSLLDLPNFSPGPPNMTSLLASGDPLSHTGLSELYGNLQMSTKSPGPGDFVGDYFTTSGISVRDPTTDLQHSSQAQTQSQSHSQLPIRMWNE